MPSLGWMAGFLPERQADVLGPHHPSDPGCLGRRRQLGREADDARLPIVELVLGRRS
jgi:hypothetical protein